MTTPVIAAYAALLLVTATARPEPACLVAVLTIPALVIVRRHAVAAVAVIVGGALLLRIGYWDTGTSDQLVVTQAALREVLAGGNPYGRGYAETLPPGAPFPYGPLALVLHAPGKWAELVASAVVLIVVARERAWYTLAILAAALAAVGMTVAGTNDYVPGALLTTGLLAVRQHPRAGAVLVALAAGVKPYAAAWFLPLVGYAGLQVVLPLIATAAAAWSPLLLWGPATYVRSLQMAQAIHADEVNALDLPHLRVLAVPVALASLAVRSWRGMAASGVLIFAIVMFLDSWASQAYWMAVLPIVGIVTEQTLRELLARRRAVAEPAAAT